MRGGHFFAALGSVGGAIALASVSHAMPEPGSPASDDTEPRPAPSAEPAPTPSPVSTPSPVTPPSPAPASAPEPFAFADFAWVPGNYGSSDRPLRAGPITFEVRIDAAYHYSFNHPADDTIGGSSEVFRHNEFQITHAGFGGDISYKNVQARLMTQFGMYASTTPRGDGSTGRGQWNLEGAYRYISEAYAGYHFDALGGINVQAGIFLSYVGLFSYYNFDNWTYQPSYISSNTPWYFNGVRAQIFPSDKLKIEPWLVNGWQSYGRFNQAPGAGIQVLYRPTGSLSFASNQYVGTDTLGISGRLRFHSDNSAMVKYFEDRRVPLSKAAVSLTLDAGCEWGGDGAAAVDCGSQYVAGLMAYHRAWFFGDALALTLGGGAMTNPGRYLVAMPPINGATAASGTPYFTVAPAAPYRAWDLQCAADYMPREFLTLRLEFDHRAASVPYFSGPGGLTPPGGNQGAPGSAVPNWAPDLVQLENRLTAAMMIKY